jgi:hypothetical protein
MRDWAGRGIGIRARLRMSIGLIEGGGFDEIGMVEDFTERMFF